MGCLVVMNLTGPSQPLVDFFSIPSSSFQEISFRIRQDHASSLHASFQCFMHKRKPPKTGYQHLASVEIGKRINGVPTLTSDKTMNLMASLGR